MPPKQDQTGAGDTGAADPGVVQGAQDVQGAQGAADQKVDAIPDDLAQTATKNAKGEVLVPIAAVLDERQKRQTLEGKVSAQDEQLYLYRMNPVGGSPVPAAQAKEQPADTKEAAVEDIFKGVDEAEIVNVGDLKKALKSAGAGESGSGGQDMNEGVQEQVGEHMLMAVHADAEEVITTNFKQRIVNEPYLANYVNSVHPMLRAFVAYRLGKGQTVQQAQAGAAKEAQAQGKADVNRVIANAAKPVATSLVAGGGGALSAADRFATISDAEMETEIENTKNQGVPA